MVTVAMAAVFMTASTVAAQTHAAPGWIDAMALDNTLEVSGIVASGRRVAVDNALCGGLRRYGHRAIGAFDQYHRFKCDLDGADRHLYEADVTFTRSVIASKPIPGRDEPTYLARDLRDALEALKAAKASITTIPGEHFTPAEKRERDRRIAAYLRPYEEAVADARAALEPYRTKFWWQIVSLRRY
jgi:hypothetical protein